jgi:hypothetical protein
VCFSFDNSNVTSKDCMRVDSVLPLDRAVRDRVPVEVANKIGEFWPSNECLYFTS